MRRARCRASPRSGEPRTHSKERRRIRQMPPCEDPLQVPTFREGLFVSCKCQCLCGARVCFGKPAERCQAMMPKSALRVSAVKGGH